MDVRNVLFNLFRTSCRIFNHAALFLLVASGAALLNDARAALPGIDGARTITDEDIVINAYTTLASAAATGSTTITVNSVTALQTTNEGALAAGDLLMIYQAQGASIDTTDTVSYGNVTNYNSSGLYEFITVGAINGNTITIGGTGGAGSGACSTLTNSYASSAQVIRVPQYTTLTIGSGTDSDDSGSIRARRWNGTTGGVVAVHVQGAMTVVNQSTTNGAVFVNGRGFRGGVAANRSGLFGQTTFRSINANFGAEKGESIAGDCARYNSIGGCYGRGAPANGGGGGNNHNAGGGGGANGANGNTWTGMGNPDTSTLDLQTAWACDDGTAGGGVPPDFTNGAGGGRGGYTYSATQNNPQTTCPDNIAWTGDNRRQVGGYGGRPLDTASGTRFFFGGGGGAGEMNNTVGGSGGAGGGLIFIIAGSFVDNTGSNASPVINANGAAGANTTGAGNDAPGGGGGGGTIVLVGGTVPATFTLNANGGAGGNQTITLNNEAEGPGGGGGGGMIAITGGTPTRTANGGANGTTNSTGLNPMFAPNGATMGWSGQATATAPSSTSRQLCGATPVVISSFQLGSDGVVQWETASEVGMVGFNLLRQDPASGQFVQVNDSLLPALIGAPQGGIYRYPDRAVAPSETYTYLLQEVEARGALRSYGPFTVTAGVGKQISRAEQVQPLIAAETTPRADGYQRAAHAPNGRTVSPLAARQPTATAQASTPKTAVRILVERDGVYVVSTDQIAAALGVTSQEAQTWINKGKIRLQQGGKPVAWRADPSGERLYFYGQAVQGVDSIYTRDNVYWLDNKRGLEMSVLAGTGPTPAASTQPFQSSIHVEENRYAFPYLVTDPDADFWYWNYVLAGDANQGAPQFTVLTPGAVAAGTAMLRAYLQGGTESITGSRHHAHVLVNGVEVGNAAWEGIVSYTLTATFDAAQLVDGNNTVTVQGELDPGVSLSAFAINSFDLDYPRAYQAVDNRLRLRGAGNPVVTVSGFRSSDIAVLNVSDPRQPQWLAATTVAPVGNDYAVSFVPATPNADYFAAVATAPVSVEGAAESTLKTPNSGADYLVLAPRSLRAGADALAAYRGGKVVELQDIYDAFNNGIVNPNAIRDFLRYAYRNWQPQPRHVALVGKGTIDPKDYQRLGTNFFPVLMAATPDGLFAADNRYADFNNNGVPELGIGRIPALTANDVTQYVAKLQTYESGGSTTALLVADNSDDAGNFAADSDAVKESLLAKGVAAKPPMPIYYQAGTAANLTRQEIINGINAGVGMINYVGHAGVTQLASEGLLRNEDVSQLTNGSQLPLFLGLTCYMGNGSIPGFDSLTETLLWRQGGGIVAALAPTGMSDNGQAHILNLGIVDALFGSGASPTLGEATNAALSGLARKGGQRYMLDIYQVFGDPALQIQR